MQKIIFIITKLELGGAQKVCLKLFQGLNKNEFETEIYTSPGGFFDQHAQESGKTKFIDGLSNCLSPKGLLANLMACWTIYRSLAKEVASNPSLIVHTHSSSAGFFGRLAAALAGVKTIVHTVHGFSFNPYQRWPKRLVFKTLEWLLAKVTSCMIFVSQKDMNVAIYDLRIPKTKCRVIRACMQHWPVKTPSARALGPAQAVTIGTVACFKPQKNLLDLLAVFANIRKQLPQAKLLIVGDGEQRSLIEALIKKNNIKNVTLLGWLENLNHFYSHIDIFALTSLWEGLPCSVVESLVRGIPVVAYDAGGISEVVQTGKNGFVVPTLDKKTFEEKLLLIIKLAKNGSIRFKTEALEHEFSPATMLKMHTNLYSQVCKNL